MIYYVFCHHELTPHLHDQSTHVPFLPYINILSHLFYFSVTCSTFLQLSLYLSYFLSQLPFLSESHINLVPFLSHLSTFHIRPSCVSLVSHLPYLSSSHICSTFPTSVPSSSHSSLFHLSLLLFYI